MYKYLVTFILIFLLQGVCLKDAECQNLLDYSTRATKFTRSYPPHEKVYLHMDNRSYFLNETLWYKAYVVDSDSNRLTKASEILHIELLSPEGAVLRTQKQRLIDGQCDGYFALDSALYSGYFEIRAYTKAMLNYDEQNYFSRVFPLFEKIKKGEESTSSLRTLPRYRTVGALKSDKEQEEAKLVATTAPNYKINFYPEGGSLVKDMESLVAFQIKDTHGNIVNTKCYLWSNQNKIVDSVSSTHLGMGVFKMTPMRENSGYYVTIKGDYKKSKFKLPKAVNKGYTLSVDNLSDSLKLKVHVGSKAYGYDLGIAILSRGCTGFSDVIKLTRKDHICDLEVDKSTLREGVNQVVLYDEQGMELASRMIFIRNNNRESYVSIGATIQGDSTNIKPYEQQEILFDIKNSEGDGVETNFSLSIYDSTTHKPTFNSDNIYTNLLLSSEVKGFIPNVDYYFESTDASRATNLDLLLQVYGWSRYNWNYLSGYERMGNKYLLEKSLAMYGRAYGQTWDSKIADGLSIYKVDRETGSGSREKRADYIYYKPTNKFTDLLGTNGVSIINVYNDSLLYYKNHEKSTSLFWNRDKLPTHRSSVNRSGQFSISFEDFYGETKVLMTSLDPDLSLGKKLLSSHLHSFFLVESEMSPHEKMYDCFEITYPQDNSISNSMINGEYISQFAIDKIDIYSKNDNCFHPAIKTKYYNQGFYSDIYPAFNRPILDRVHSRGLTSLERYQDSYDIDSYVVNNGIIEAEIQTRIGSIPYKTIVAGNIIIANKEFDYYRCGPYWSRNRHIAYPTEYLNYYKLPLGSIAFISNTTVDTTNVTTDRSYYTTPLKHETVDIVDYNLDPSKYTCYLDSTVIHTDSKVIDEIYSKFKDHSEYQQYEIHNNDRSPTKTSSKDRPNYVVEHFCRIIRQKAKRDVVLNKSTIVREIPIPPTYIEGYEMAEIGFTKEVIRVNKYSQYDKVRRAIIFQGLTRMDMEFYTPDYSKTPLPAQGDHRRTLYWNPNVETDVNGQASVKFYNNSNCTKYHIDAQTVTKGGEIGELSR